MANLKADKNGNIIGEFATTRPLAVTSVADAAFTSVDIAFCVPTGCTYTINGGTAMTLLAGAVRAIRSGYVYRFDTSMTLEVM
jgi:pantoate kinase